MYFNRFDIVEAYYCFAYNFYKHSQALCEICCKFDGQLERLRFKPRLSLYGGEPKSLSENGKVIYMALVHKYCGIH